MAQARFGAPTWRRCYSQSCRRSSSGALNPRHWLHVYLTACAENGGLAPADLTPFLPWTMDEASLHELKQPAEAGISKATRPRSTPLEALLWAQISVKQNLTLIRTLIAEDPKRTRADLSRLACQAMHWLKPDGGLKDMSCRVAMLRMQGDGLIQLPPPRCPRPQTNIRIGVETDSALTTSPARSCLARLATTAGRQPQTDSRLWNEYIHRYHYLGFKTLPGAQLRYWVTAGDRLVALLGFGAAAWQCAPRDQFIGWTHEQRQKNLHLVVNNARFLILPWVCSENLASKVLGLAARQLPQDWQHRYGFRPLLLETFVEKDRFTGTCYRAANWLHVGQTQGRGKLGPSGKQSVPIKDVWLYPLGKAFKYAMVR